MTLALWASRVLQEEKKLFWSNTTLDIEWLDARKAIFKQKQVLFQCHTNACDAMLAPASYYELGFTD